ncbi:uncharacterized protein LOC129781915 [Toxorhynchites rutilus septentrionalis]|uniref:uncharacterized protein LOC129781915 n=1 Tax=Toxorhynchites rutilus septentrionalis TaxID=329112 RepID=UPI0024796D58|nr:uncharacterized protein LOC129781915 [Toxorhynchites rutilus septentrionalis]
MEMVGKNSASCVNVPLVSGNDGDKILNLCPPSHITLGLVNTIFESVEKKAPDWVDLINKFSKKPRKKIHRVYDEELLQKCLESVKTGGKTIYRASKSFWIPVSTIRFRMGEKWTKKIRKGPPTVLHPDDEIKIIHWLKEMESKGFPVFKETFFHKVKSFFENNSNPNPFKNGVPGRKWFAGFLNRHKGQITIRTPEGVSAASSVVSEFDIRGWFTRVEKHIEDNGLGEILLEPNRMYNGDETSFFLHPKTKAMLATPGNRNIHEIEHASPHTNITVMFTFGADGSMVPPDVILPMQRIRQELLRSFPGDWGIGKSPKR